MKTPLLFVATFIALTTPSVFAQSSEEEAIKAVIRAETEAYYRRDSTAWAATRLHEENTTVTFVSNNSYSTSIGWEKIRPEILKDLKDNPKPIPVEIANGSYLIRTDGSLAWVEYDQTLTAPAIDPKIKRISKEQRLLVKQDGQWRIANQITTDPETFGTSPEAVEGNLNTVGYNLLNAKKVKEAIEVFKTNVKLYPKSANAYDSLGEAYAAAGNKAMAIGNYEQSLKLNPKSESGKMALAKLKGK